VYAKRELKPPTENIRARHEKREFKKRFNPFRNRCVSTTFLAKPAYNMYETVIK